VGGMIVGAAAERAMHADDDAKADQHLERSDAAGTQAADGWETPTEDPAA
jgi:hypothetical protein